MGLEAKVLFNQNNRNAPRYHLSIDDQQFIHRAIDAIGIESTLVFKWQRVLLNAAQPLIEINHRLIVEMRASLAVVRAASLRFWAAFWET